MSEIKRYFPSRFGEDGYVTEIDLGQIEIVVQGFLSGDPQLCEDIRNGVCIHSKRLSQKLGEPYEDVYRKAKVEKDPWYAAQRDGSKSYTFESALF